MHHKLTKINHTKQRKQHTRKNHKKYSETNTSSILQKFENDISSYFFEVLLMVKLFHWKTYSYSTHKATDELYSKINENMDKFIEVLLGKTGIRINLKNKKYISLIDPQNKEQFIKHIDSFKSYLINLSTNKAMQLMSNVDLYTIRDELLADINQFLYLLSLH